MMTETVVNVQEAPNNNAANKQQTSADSALSWFKINVDYFRTTPGIIKIAEFILGILCMALASPAIGGVHFFVAIASLSFITTVVWILVYLTGFRDVNIPINWVLSELLNTGLCAFFYIIAVIVQLISAISHSYGGYIAAVIFGFINMCAYCFGTYLLNLEWKANRTTN